jgi:hypothetical protein
MAARKLFEGYGITELRTYAKEYKLPGRSKMTGVELLAAVRAVWEAERIAKEQAVLNAGPVAPGTVLRFRSAPGTTIRVTSDVLVDEIYGSLYVRAEYVTADEKEHTSVAYLNQKAPGFKFYLFTLEAMPKGMTLEQAQRASLTLEDVFTAPDVDDNGEGGDAGVISEISEDGKRAYVSGRLIDDWYRLEDLIATEDL